MVELLTVLAIVIALAGMSIAVFQKLPRRFAHEQAEKQIQMLLRRARSAALESRRPAEVTLQGDRLAISAWKPVLQLRFEDAVMPPEGTPGRTSGPRGAYATLHGVAVDAGKLGQGVYAEVASAYVDVGNAPILSPPRGVRLSVQVWPGNLRDLLAEDSELGERPPPPEANDPDAPWEFQIAAKEGEYFLRMREDYGLAGGVVAEDGRAVWRETPAAVLTPKRWAEVTLIYDGETVQILVNGLSQQLPPLEDERGGPIGQVTATAAPLHLSSPEPGLTFYGGLDELRIDGLGPEAELTLPPSVTVSGPERVRFDGLGQLDPLFHETPIEFIVRLVTEEEARRDGAPEETTAPRVDPGGEASFEEEPPLGADPAQPRTADSPRHVIVERSGVIR
ncbi:MAG: hypothetical protein ACYS22_15110 [Planctomycetota bacterium]|jgi:type II secretory pathway pseudopilin PulG